MQCNLAAGYRKGNRRSFCIKSRRQLSCSTFLLPDQAAVYLQVALEFVMDKVLQCRDTWSSTQDEFTVTRGKAVLRDRTAETKGFNPFSAKQNKSPRKMRVFQGLV
jgi:hypothetical protein